MLICSDEFSAKSTTTTTALHSQAHYPNLNHGQDSQAHTTTLTHTPHNRIVASRRDSRFSGRAS